MFRDFILTKFDWILLMSVVSIILYRVMEMGNE